MESRLTELEIKLAYQEDLLDTLNATVARQQQQLDLLQAQFQLLYRQMQTATDGAAGTADPMADIPPHY